MDKIFSPLGILLCCVVDAPEYPFGGEEPLDPHGAPGVYSSCRNPNLSPETKSESVSKPEISSLDFFLIRLIQFTCDLVDNFKRLYLIEKCTKGMHKL